jgi:hypothetical protein
MTAQQLQWLVDRALIWHAGEPLPHVAPATG